MIIEYNTALDRPAMAKFVSCCFGDNVKQFLPYKPNEHDDSFWTVDVGNDWKVKFFPDKPTEMEIIHRYDNDVAVMTLASWVAYRTGGTLQ